MGQVAEELHAAIAKAMRAVPEPETIEAHDQQEARTQRADRLARSGCKVPDDVREAIIASNVTHRRTMQVLNAWFTDPKREAVLVLAGNSGCGKTVALATMAALRDIRYLGADDLNRIFAANFGEQLVNQDQIRETPLLLALDDIGTELDETRMLPTLLEIINARVSAARTPTVIATNLTKQEFAARYPNERLLSRMQRVRWVPVQGEDLRRRARPNARGET
jgi:DNA replication protein DnaC